MKRLIWLLLSLSGLPHAMAQKSLKKMPAGFTATETGRKVSARFVATPHTNFGNPGLPGSLTYSEVCAWYGALRFAHASKDKALTNQLKERFEPMFGTEKKLVPRPDHVDNNVFGTVPLELYLRTKEQRYYDLGMRFADKQWELPDPQNPKAGHKKWADKGMSWMTRLWIDDMFMITAIQSQAYKVTGDRKYIDRAANEMAMYMDSIQRPNGLFFHAPDVPFFWGRGNGWMAAGFTELLKALPEDHPQYARIMLGYKTMMASLKTYQGKDGMWNQLVDDPAAWPETSCTGMFAYAMITGVKKGWLPEKEYGPVARKAWLALVTYIDENGDVREVCQGTNKKNDRQYYLDRKRITGDMHGQAPVLWCATALLEK